MHAHIILPKPLFGGDSRHVWQPGEDSEQTFESNANKFGAFNKEGDNNFRGTDVCVININDGVAFENVPFQYDDGTIPPLKGLVTPDTDLNNMAPAKLWSNYPYTGALDGMLAAFGLAESIMRKEGRSSEAEAKSAENIEAQIGLDPDTELIETRELWIYYGNRADSKMKKGMCGSAIVDSVGLVRGFFHVYCSEGPFKGLSYAVGAQLLSEKGYRLAPKNGLVRSE